MEDLVNISVGTAGIVGLLGYLVVFFGLVLLMLVIMCMASVFIKKAKNSAEASAEAPVTAEAVPEKEALPAAPGSAGDIKLYNTDPRDAAIIMAIVADQLGKPINELRFKSIREVSSK